jgi:hypothetical protein
LNFRRRATAPKLPDMAANDLPHLVAPRVPKRLTASEISGAAPLKVRPVAIQYLAALPEYANVSDEALIGMARQKTCRKIHVQDRWVAIALLLGTRDVLPTCHR